MVELLLVQIFSPLILPNFLPEGLILKKIEMVKSMRIPRGKRIGQASIHEYFMPYSHYEPRVLLLLPILQVVQKVDKSWLRKDILLRQRMQIERIC